MPQIFLNLSVSNNPEMGHSNNHSLFSGQVQSTANTEPAESSIVHMGMSSQTHS